MKTLYGYAGRMLRVNLSTGGFRVEPLPEDLARDYIGGRGFAARLLYDELPPGIDPLSPENKVVIASGPLAGVFLPAGRKVTMAAKSPATGGYGDSNMGGHLAAEMKYAGYDVIIIEGKRDGRLGKPAVALQDEWPVVRMPSGDPWVGEAGRTEGEEKEGDDEVKSVPREAGVSGQDDQVRVQGNIEGQEA